jgi:hypothetical protein
MRRWSHLASRWYGMWWLALLLCLGAAGAAVAAPSGVPVRNA